MSQKTKTILLVVAATILLAAPVLAGKGAPSFSPAIYADGRTWATKVTTLLPAPNEYNRQSFDKFFVVTNSNSLGEQLPVSEAAPGSPGYNGGRWFTHTVEWTEDGFRAHGYVPLLTSYEQIMEEKNNGYLVITPGSFPNGPPVYFQCPLLPVKD